MAVAATATRCALEIDVCNILCGEGHAAEGRRRGQARGGSRGGGGPQEVSAKAEAEAAKAEAAKEFVSAVERQKPAEATIQSLQSELEQRAAADGYMYNALAASFSSSFTSRRDRSLLVDDTSL